MHEHKIYDRKLPKAVTAYLNKFADDTHSAVIPADKKYGLILAIPALAEFENIRRFLFSLSQQDFDGKEKVLALIIVNNPVSANEDIKRDNRTAMEYLRKVVNREELENPYENEIIKSPIDVGYIDAASEGLELPDKTGGVGLARKICMDLALTLFDYPDNPDQIIACPDADCILEENYLQEIYENFSAGKLNAGYVDYRHLRADEETNLAITCYEIFLHYYVAGLKYAGSPYGFHTIGSTMLCTAEAYMKVQGMNKKKAAEDFYFMEKLGKNYEVNFLPETAVYPSPRPSFRVPFGTGQRVGRYLSKVQNEYLLYHPESFVILKKWNELFLAETDLNAEDYLKKSGEIDPALRKFLELNKFSEQWERIRKNTSSVRQLQLQKKLWFDGFRTLKFIHFLRDNGYPLQDMFETLNLFFNLAGEENIEYSGQIPELDVQTGFLDVLRKLNGHKAMIVY